MTVDRKLPRYCGLQKDLKMESDGAFFRVTFKSNDRFDGTGFYASYQFTPVADAVTITRRRSSSTVSATPCKSIRNTLSTVSVHLSLLFPPSNPSPVVKFLINRETRTDSRMFHHFQILSSASCSSICSPTSFRRSLIG